MENRLDTPSSERSALSRRGLLGAAGATGLAAGMLAVPELASAKSHRRRATQRIHGRLPPSRSRARWRPTASR